MPNLKPQHDCMVSEAVLSNTKVLLCHMIENRLNESPVGWSVLQSEDTRARAVAALTDSILAFSDDRLHRALFDDFEFYCVYETWLHQQPDIMPRWFYIKTIKGLIYDWVGACVAQVFEMPTYEYYTYSYIGKRILEAFADERIWTKDFVAFFERVKSAHYRGQATVHFLTELINLTNEQKEVLCY